MIKHIGTGVALAFGWCIGLVLFLTVAVVIALGFPQENVLRVTGVEIRHIDDQGVINREQNEFTREVFFINTEDPRTGEPRVFRNEDTGWSFPFRFKFDSADIQAKADSLARTGSLAVVSYYGQRSHMFSTFPNVTALKPTDRYDVSGSWRWYIWLAIVVIGLIFMTRAAGAIIRLRRQSKEDV